MLPESEPGVITAIDGSLLTIQLVNTDVCDLCGLRVVCKPGDEDNRSLQVNAAGDFHVGQQVKIQEQLNLEWQLATIQYVLPLILFIAGLLLFYFIPVGNFPKELMSFLGGCLGLLLSFFLSRSLMASLARGKGRQAIRVIPIS